MADHAHSMPASVRAASICARMLAALALSFLFALAAIGLAMPDPVTAGRAVAVEAVR
ncbi:hypothetical protein [Brytella acorum]|uniref:Uncharacterized protein n=1 Tax=Brytella acorum TaxID=2959299 RepID=A0AA35UPM4_9PROT|nr:hypothetical protein [Brytella acorum]MDF3625707.1 hypothetical protein [Brytella acorum]CAI9121336.1 hypothetical protein LMG32879_002183 [Brytella acorum]